MATYIEMLIITYGVFAVFLLMALNGFFSGPPSEVVLSISGAIVSLYSHDFIHMFFAALLGNLLGTYLLYLLARHSGHEWLFTLKNFLYRNNNVLIKSTGHLIPDQNTYDFVSNRFRLNGRKWVCLFRCFPIVRSIISVPAGVVKMNTINFLFFSSVGISVWTLVWQLLGFYTIHNWNKYQWYISVPLVLIFLIMIVVTKRGIFKYIRDNKAKYIDSN